MSEDLSQVLRHRREKLEQLLEKGVQPFAYGFDRSHMAAEARAVFEDAEASESLDESGHASSVRTAGRIVSFRSHGKSAFAHIEDGSGQIQLYFKKNVLGDARFEDLDLFDLGDWIGVEGPLFRTRTGEVTVQVTEYELLSKSLRPLPLGKTEVDEETGERVTHSGFQETEARYRQRYADLAVNPEVREVFRLRTDTIRELRSFLDGRGFQEVETPTLQPLYGGAAARPFVTTHNALDRTLYLRIADELYLKRCIVGGMERVYEICKDFRNEGMDRNHSPEFTMLEFYAAFMDYEDVLALAEEMLSTVVQRVTGGYTVHFQGEDISFEPPFARISMMDALSEALGQDAMAMDQDALMAEAKRRDIPELEGAGRGKLWDKLFGELVEPSLTQPTFVMDHPRQLSPLAKPKRGNPELTERFELVCAAGELCNAFSELNDPIDQRERFEAQAQLRTEGDDEAMQIDEDFIRALEYGMPPTGGLGMGVDRFIMLLTDQPNIRDVILFPALRD